MVACRFFLQGCCRYGDNCRFEHSYAPKYTYNAPQEAPPSNNSITVDQLLNLVVPEVNAALKSKQWLLSCYGPFKNKPNFPGLFDVSPEELRLSFYEAQLNGTLADNINHLKVYQQNILKNFQSLLKPSTKIIGTIQSLYRGEPTIDPFDTPSYGGVTYTDTRLINNIFGNDSQPGNVASNDIIFNTSCAFPSSTNAFANNLFSQGLAQTNANFGDPFQVSTQNIFVNKPDASQMVGVNSNASNFEQSHTTAQEISPSALFASANAQIHQENHSAHNIFLKTPNATVPDQRTQQNPFVGIPSNVFGINKLANSSFGGNEISQTDCEEIYTKIEHVTQSNLALFENKVFSHGHIPELAPPYELCN